MEVDHVSVLLNEAIMGLAIQPTGCYIDGTFGRGGHSAAILEHLNQQGRLLAIDKDFTAIEAGKIRFQQESRIFLQQGSFTALDTLSRDVFENAPVNGILLDLGVSSPQLDDPQRGFSFKIDGPLDMRMNNEQTANAADWVNTAAQEEIANVLWEYGEERFSRRIAQFIVEARQKKAITRTQQLAELIRTAIPKYIPHKHPATRSFQAIRIFINQELDDLKNGLHTALETLAIGGRLAVISFHSLEDRIVKTFMNTYAKGHEALRQLPLTEEQLGIRLRLVGKAIKPSTEEIAHNVRARSAILRIGEKCR